MPIYCHELYIDLVTAQWTEKQIVAGESQASPKLQKGESQASFYYQ